MSHSSGALLKQVATTHQSWSAETGRTPGGEPHCPAGVRNVSGFAQSARLHGRPQSHDPALALAERQGRRRARRWPSDRLERSHALGFVRILRTPDCTAGILGPGRGAAAARIDHEDFRRMGRAALRAVYVPAECQTHRLVPEVWVLAA